MARKVLLTPEKESQRSAFIVKCVDANATLEYSGKFGRIDSLTIQDIVHLNVDTLRKVGEQLEQIAAKHGGSRFSKGSTLQIPSNSGIGVGEWLDLLEMQLQIKEEETKEEKKAEKIKELQGILESLETPEERKGKVLQQLAELTGSTYVTAQAVPAPTA